MYYNNVQVAETQNCTIKYTLHVRDSAVLSFTDNLIIQSCIKYVYMHVHKLIHIRSC